MKAPAVLINTVRRVQKSKRLEAAKLAEKAYFSAMEKLELFGDFERGTLENLAAESAAAEVSYLFRLS